MQKRIIAILATFLMLYGSTLIPAAGSGGVPVKAEAKPELEPIKPVEVKYDTGTERGSKDVVVGDESGDAGAVQGILARTGTTGDGTVPDILPAGLDRVYAPNEGESGNVEVDPDGTEGTEPDNQDDSGADQVADPEPEPAIEEPQMEYLGDFTISGYCSCSSCCGQWSGGPCADGSYPEEGYTCAMGGLDFGTVLYIDGVGYRTICDRGTDYGWVDLYFTNHDSALAWGLQTRSVWIVR